MKIKFKKHLAILMTLAICLSMLWGLSFTASAEAKTATISFANISQRTTQNNSKQVWYNGGVTLTNNKAASSSNVGNYSNPARFYASSEIIIECTGMTQILFDANSSTYATALKNSIGTVSGATVTASSDKVTVAFTNAVDSFKIAKLTAQVRMDSITVTYNEAELMYTVSAESNNTEYGTVEVDGNVVTAIPKNNGYEVVGYEVAPEGAATVVRSGNEFTVTPTSDVTIIINFAARQQHTVSFNENGIVTSTQKIYSGDSVKLPTFTSDEYTTVGWMATTIDGETTTAPAFYPANSNYTVKDNVTFYALYSRMDESSGGVSNVFEKYTGTMTEGDYIIVGANSTSTATSYGALKASISSKRFAYTEVTVSNDSISSTDSTIIWKATSVDGNWTFYNEGTSKYAASNGVKNQAAVAASVTNNAKWTVSGTTTRTIENVGNKAANINYTLRRNGTYGFACYATNTGTAPILFKRVTGTIYYFTTPAAAEPTGTITGAQVSVGADLSVKYFATVENATEVSMKFTVENVDPVTVEGVLVDGKYEFVFPGIAPQRMGDNIKAELIANGKVIATKDDYSIKANAQNILNNDETTDKAKQFVTDMLYYGAAAQKYAGYKVNNLATDGVEGLGTPSDATPTATDLTLTKTTGSASFKSATVWFDSVNKLIVKINNAESVTLKVNGVAVTVTDGVYTTEEIKVVDFDKVFTLELVENDQTVQTLTYSVNSYAYSKQSSTNSAMAELAIALYRLGAAAENI